MMDPQTLPAMVMPLHDPNRVTLPHLKAITPALQNVFGKAYVSLTETTRQAQPDYATWLEGEEFFHIFPFQADGPAGVHFNGLYTFASQACPREQVLHLCYIDRVAFAMSGEYRERFLAEAGGITAERTPLIFQRSIKAWESHPSNYRDLEQTVTRAGELLFGKTVDFAWCHMAIQAGRLREILPKAKNRDISMVAEMALEVLEEVQTQDADWLAWEDPFIEGVEAQALKQEREESQEENLKRLAYVIPMLEILYERGKGMR
jgi:hypothetical protein